MLEQNISQVTQAGLAELDELLKRQRRLLNEIQGKNVANPGGNDTSQVPRPIADDADAIAQELEQKLGISSARASYPKDFGQWAREMDGADAELVSGNKLPLASKTTVKLETWLIAGTIPGARVVEEISPGESTRKVNAKKDNRARSKRRLTGTIFYAALIALVVLALTLTGNGGAPRDIFGYSVLSVLTTSMQSEIPQGSLVLVKHVDPNTLRVGDDITYMYTATASITHKVVAIYENYSDGQRGFQTKGVNNSAPDQDIVPAANVVGKAVFHVPVLGSAALYIKDHILLLSVILVGIGGLLALLFITLRWMMKPDRPAVMTPVQ